MLWCSCFRVYVRISENAYTYIWGMGEMDILVLEFSYLCKQIDVAKHSQFVINVTVDIS